MVYAGVNHRYINPLRILSQDIVMVTYESLRRELDRVHHQEFTRMLRKKKKWAYPPSPLLAIHWWRVCLDEAQMVESVNTKVHLNGLSIVETLSSSQRFKNEWIMGKTIIFRL